MQKIVKNLHIGAPVEKVFSLIEDPETLLDVMPGLMEVTDIIGSGIGQHYRWAYKMVGIRFEGESTVTDLIPNKKRVVEGKGGILSTWTWTFDAHENETMLNLVLEYEIPFPVLGKLAENLVLKRNEREAETLMANLKDKCEAKVAQVV